MTDSPNEEPSQLALGVNNIRKYYTKKFSEEKYDFILGKRRVAQPRFKLRFVLKTK